MKDMGILEKDPSKVEVETETDNYEENFDSELTWEDEVDIEENNVLNNFNPVKALIVEAKEPKKICKEQSIYEMLIEYADIIYTDMKELAKTNIIQHIIHLLNSTLITQGCHPMD